MFCDTSVKDGAIGDHWVAMTKKNEILMSHETRTKKWSFNSPKTAEAVILLDLIATLHSRARNTNNGKADIHVNNKETLRRAITATRVTNDFNQDSVAETKAI